MEGRACQYERVYCALGASNIDLLYALCLGSYSESRGIKIVREHVAEFISERDGFPCSYKSVYLLNGASEGIKTMLFIVMDNTDTSNKTGILIPRPQYPLYSAAIAQLNAVKV